MWQIVMVMESVADALVAMVNEKIAKLKVGQPEDNADITAVVSASSADFIQVCSRLLRVAPCVWVWGRRTCIHANFAVQFTRN